MFKNTLSISERGATMMTNRWKQRGLALMAVLALAVPAAGMDSDPMDVVELYEPQLSYTDDAEPVEEQEDAWLPVEPDDPDMYDPVYNPEYADPEYVAPANDVLSSEETDIPADENAPDAGEPIPEQTPPETTDTEGIAAAPEIDGGEATAEKAEKAEKKEKIYDFAGDRMDHKTRRDEEAARIPAPYKIDLRRFVGDDFS